MRTSCRQGALATVMALLVAPMAIAEKGSTVIPDGLGLSDSAAVLQNLGGRKASADKRATSPAKASIGKGVAEKSLRLPRATSGKQKEATRKSPALIPGKSLLLPAVSGQSTTGGKTKKRSGSAIPSAVLPRAGALPQAGVGKSREQKSSSGLRLPVLPKVIPRARESGAGLPVPGGAMLPAGGGGAKSIPGQRRGMVNILPAAGGVELTSRTAFHEGDPQSITVQVSNGLLDPAERVRVDVLRGARRHRIDFGLLGARMTTVERRLWIGRSGGPGEVFDVDPLAPGECLTLRLSWVVGDSPAVTRRELCREAMAGGSSGDGGMAGGMGGSGGSPSGEGGGSGTPEPGGGLPLPLPDNEDAVAVMVHTNPLVLLPRSGFTSDEPPALELQVRNRDTHPLEQVVLRLKGPASVPDLELELGGLAAGASSAVQRVWLGRSGAMPGRVWAGFDPSAESCVTVEMGSRHAGNPELRWQSKRLCELRSVGSVEGRAVETPSPRFRVIPVRVIPEELIVHYDGDNLSDGDWWFYFEVEHDSPPSRYGRDWVDERSWDGIREVTSGSRINPGLEPIRFSRVYPESEITLRAIIIDCDGGITPGVDRMAGTMDGRPSCDGEEEIYEATGQNDIAYGELVISGADLDPSRPRSYRLRIRERGADEPLDATLRVRIEPGR